MLEVDCTQLSSSPWKPPDAVPSDRDQATPALKAHPSHIYARRLVQLRLCGHLLCLYMAFPHGHQVTSVWLDAAAPRESRHITYDSLAQGLANHGLCSSLPPAYFYRHLFQLTSSRVTTGCKVLQMYSCTVDKTIRVWPEKLKTFYQLSDHFQENAAEL